MGDCELLRDMGMTGIGAWGVREEGALSEVRGGRKMSISGIS